MIVAAPVSHPARLLPHIAAGAVLGVAMREASALMWPMPIQQWVCMLLFAVLAAFPLGWMLVVGARPRLLAVAWGWSAGLSSIAATSIVALGVPLLWGLAMMVLVPLSAAAGVVMGAIVGVKRHQRHPVAEEQPVPDEAAP
jgi:uncharacterized membrane protein (DUF485 family)